jgi:hypothetical protein
VPGAIAPGSTQVHGDKQPGVCIRKVKSAPREADDFVGYGQAKACSIAGIVQPLPPLSEAGPLIGGQAGAIIRNGDKDHGTLGHDGQPDL